MIYGTNGNAFKVNPFILLYTCLQHIKFQDQVIKIFNKFRNVTSILYNHIRLNSVVDMGNEFFGDWGQHEFRENIKQQSKHDILTKALAVLELL